MAETIEVSDCCEAAFDQAGDGLACHRCRRPCVTVTRKRPEWLNDR